jgi:hypothetical protein
MNQSLARLVEKKLITRDAAFSTSSNRDELITILERGVPQMGAAGTLAQQRAKAPLAGAVR